MGVSRWLWSTDIIVEVSGVDSSEPVEDLSGNIDGLAPEATGGGSVGMKLIWIWIQVNKWKA
jgi:hypothetical protein